MTVKIALEIKELHLQILWLALRNITASWGRKPANDWHLAMNQSAILYEDRFTAPTA